MAQFKDNVAMAIRDYKTVFQEIGADVWARPIAATAKLCLVAGLAHVATETPSEEEFRSKVVEANFDLMLLPRSLRNPASYEHVKKIADLQGEGRIRYTNLVFGSLITSSAYSPKAMLFEAKHQSFQTWVLGFRERIVDVGFYGHYWLLEQAMVDFDVNFDE